MLLSRPAIECITQPITSYPCRCARIRFLPNSRPCGDRLCRSDTISAERDTHVTRKLPNPPRRSAVGCGLLRQYCIRLHAGITEQWQVADFTRGFHATHSEVGHQPAPIPPR